MSQSEIILTHSGDPLGAGDSEPPIKLAEYLQLVLRRWRLILVVCILTVGIGLVHYFITPEAFRSSTVLQIEQQTLVRFSSESNPWLDAWASIKYYPTQYRLLQSRGLAERVVLKLRLMDDPDFNPSAASDLDGSGMDPAEVARLANRLRLRLEVDPVKDTELVRLSYASSDPELAARIVNATAEAFIDWGIESRTDTIGRASSFLAEQIETLKLEIDAKENQLQEYSRSSDIVAIDPNSNVTLQRLDRLNQEYIVAMSVRLDKEARLSAVRSSPEFGGLASIRESALFDLRQEYETKLQTYKSEWPTMVELRAKIVEAEANLTDVLDEEARDARQTAVSEFQTARRRELALLAEIERTKTDAMDLSGAAVEYNNLRMEISTRRELQDELLKQFSAAGVSARLTGTRESNVRVVDRALVPSGAFRPSLSSDLSFGLSSGLLLGVGLIFLIHFLDRTVKTPEELETILGLPVLAVIPDITSRSRGYGYRLYGRYGYGYGYGYGADPSGEEQGDKQSLTPVSIELLPQEKPRLAVSEAYRSLRTALLLSSAGELRVVTITSAESGEGKTVTVSNLAVVMAQLGRRVLLIDGDLRKSRMHKIFKITNRYGIVTFLTSNADPQSLFHSTGIDNLTLCSAGPHPPNPSELLASDRMKEFLEYCRSHFDLILIDTPPLLAVTDAVLPATLSDGVVLCVRANKVMREDAREVRDRLMRADVKILGVVLNRYQPTRGGSYSKRYYYTPYEETVKDHAA